MNIQIRPEHKNDISTISMINDMAFGQEAEGNLIVKLRKKKSFIKDLSLVACMGNEIIGHILFSKITIKNDTEEFESLALAPMSVIPEFQGLGIGSQLIKKGLEKAAKLGYESVIVLGHENYYPRFNFTPASRFQISCPFEVPDASFMALELKKESLGSVSGCVIYPNEFNNL
ncbi:N-acetyltransferase [Ancylomarina euxinus]|uniref:N-acetyltransferase n=1 Tax=Ancylomarina euxinus TaxID=2283627 RepID=A0A425Y3G9_9BACT|nr:N-acetyltransferase [Ancylomarina euxinus]MCZ4693235.1 N-acetyltransferase [Ancylomarina euxinus]MUP15371.1 GNAT family N-acetyltransferase [Ancylomarina euxinus]RRG22506.1 N-acetyltransferase [Ancylomarina euxinus]